MAEVPFRAGGFAPRTIPFAGAATIVLLLALWQAAAGYGLISTRFLPPPLGQQVDRHGIDPGGIVLRGVVRMRIVRRHPRQAPRPRVREATSVPSWVSRP